MVEPTHRKNIKNRRIGSFPQFSGWKYHGGLINPLLLGGGVALWGGSQDSLENIPKTLNPTSSENICWDTVVQEFEKAQQVMIFKLQLTSVTGNASVG